MDSVKAWDLDQGRMGDIVMKPQTLIYDLNFTAENIFVLEFCNTPASSQVILSQVKVEELNLQSLPSMEEEPEQKARPQNQQNNLDFYHPSQAK
mmetsp:Transcript_42400/g.31050  ORF Transcript_42400/g.31050 Transcript_42400/m.31050 type:complete len:94 (+) Transcript_42400:305-586(+)